MECGIKKNTRRESNMLFALFLFAFFILLFSFIQTPHASATTSTLTLSVIDKLSLNVSSLNSDGVFATSDTSANNISVLTNNGTGYLLGIKASTEGENALVNATDSSKTIPSHTISAGVSKNNYNDASYASANNLNNTWGFRPSTYYDTANNVTINNTTSNLYFPGPSSTTNSFIIDKTSSANVTANEYNIALGTRINNSTSPGRYTNVFVITAVANPILYSITYNQNTTDTVTNMPTNVVDQPTFDETVNIDNTVPARDGFNFKGWCTTQVADGGTCTGTTYNPDGGGTALTWTLDQTISSNSLNLYAMWAQALTMQTAKLSDCGKIMPDSRDGQRYTTTLIGDSCWMTTNLNLAGGTTLTPELSNVSSNYTLPNSSSAGFSNNSTPYVYNSGSTTCGDNSPCYSYYSYVAATAGTNPSSGDAKSDICPKGWKVPSKSDFESLTNIYNTGAKLTASPFLAVYGGFFGDSTYYSRFGSDLLGAYWSSTADSGSNGYYLYYTNSIAPIIADGKHYGGSIRCVKDLYMQDVDSWESEVGTGGETTAVDKRDGNKYTIARLSDGNLWMTQNLRFQGTDLKVGESDVTSDITMTYGQLTSGNSYTEPRIATGSTTDYGTYYNYCAASAGEVCNDTTKQDATRSVCPAGWKLPTLSQLNAVPQKDSHFTDLSGVAGYYYGGSLADLGKQSGWCSSSADNTDKTYAIGYDGIQDIWYVRGYDRFIGGSVRCVRAS